MAIRVEVRLFARLREVCGRAAVQLEVPAGADPATCFDCLATEHPGLRALRSRLAVAVNEEYSDWERQLAPGDVVTFIPPVSGGAGPRLIELTSEVISAGALRERVRDTASGAIVTFEGTVRGRTDELLTDHLEYEAYGEMAEQELARIADEAREHWPVTAVAIHHRLGRLEVGEVSVAIAVSAPHRSEAFSACRFVIDELKRRVPIWKKEVGPDGAAWIEGPDRAPEPAGRGGGEPGTGG